MIQFFAPEISTNPVLPETESQHAIKVLRLSAGAIIPVTDGAGYRYECRIIEPHPKHTLVEIINSVTVERPWPSTVTVAVAPTKHLDRIEWMVEKLVEIGVDRFVPLLCRHSERKELKTARIQKIAVSAMNQSLKGTLPAIEPITPLAEFIKSTDSSSQKFVGYCDESIPRHLLSRSIKPFEDTVILIGPEGDFSPEEIEITLKAGFQPVTLGDIRLRTETAAVCALQTYHVINQLA